MKVKLAVSALLAFLVFIFVTQNTDVVHVTFLAWSIEISLALLVFVMLWAGLVIGWLLNSYLRFSRTRKRQLAENPPVQEQAGESTQEMETPVVTEEKQEV